MYNDVIQKKIMYNDFRQKNVESKSIYSELGINLITEVTSDACLSFN